MKRLNRIWRCNTISFASKLLVNKSLLTAILRYGCETSTFLLTEKKKKKDPGFQNQAHEVQEPLLATVKRRKLAWFGHVTRHESLSKTILQGTVEGWRRRGRQRKCWMGDIKEWTSCPCQNCSQGPSAERTARRALPNRPSCPNNDPNRPRNRTEPNRTEGEGTCRFVLV